MRIPTLVIVKLCNFFWNWQNLANTNGIRQSDTRVFKAFGRMTSNKCDNFCFPTACTLVQVCFNSLFFFVLPITNISMPKIQRFLINRLGYYFLHFLGEWERIPPSIYDIHCAGNKSALKHNAKVIFQKYSSFCGLNKLQWFEGEYAKPVLSQLENYCR